MAFLGVLRAWVNVCLGLLPLFMTGIPFLVFWVGPSMEVRKALEGGRLEPPTSQDDLLAFLRADALLITVLPLIATAVGLGVASLGLPSWVLVASAAPFVARALYVDFKLSSQYLRVDNADEGSSTGGGWKSWCMWATMDFLLSKLEILDALSDGVVVAKAFLLDNDANAHFSASLHNLPSWIRVPMSLLALRGLLALVLLLGMWVQVCYVLDPIAKACTLASQAGLGGVAATRDNLERGVMKRARFLGRVLCEGLPQLLLQTSVPMAQGRALLEDPVLAMSLLLSTLTVAHKAAEMPAVVVQILKAGRGALSEPAASLSPQDATADPHGPAKQQRPPLHTDPPALPCSPVSPSRTREQGRAPRAAGARELSMCRRNVKSAVGMDWASLGAQ